MNEALKQLQPPFGAFGKAMQGERNQSAPRDVLRALQVFMDSSMASRQFSEAWEAVAEGLEGLPVQLWRLRLGRGEAEHLVRRLLAGSGSSARLAMSELPLLFVVPPDCTYVGCISRCDTAARHYSTHPAFVRGWNRANSPSTNDS